MRTRSAAVRWARWRATSIPRQARSISAWRFGSISRGPANERMAEIRAKRNVFATSGYRKDSGTRQPRRVRTGNRQLSEAKREHTMAYINAGYRLDRVPITRFHRRVFALVGIG